MGEWDSLKGLGLFSGLSPLCSVLLSALIQDSSFSLSPYFFVYLLGGAITYIISLFSLNEAKPGFLKNVWNLAGVATAGYVLVYWAKYYSGLLSIVVEVCLLFIVVVNLFFFLYPKLLAQKYQKRVRILFTVALLFSLFFSALAILPINKPNLVVSPSSNYVVFINHLQGTQDGNINVSTHQLQEIQDENINVSITSTLGDAYNIQLIAESDDKNNLTTYIDGIKRGPKEIPSIYRGKGESVVLRIQTSPEIQLGTYCIYLNYTYHDFLGKTYKGSDSINVYVHRPYDSNSAMAPTMTPGFDVVIAILTLLILALRRRPQ